MANPKSQEARRAYLDSVPFEGFKISDDSILGQLEGRHPCPNCGKSRKFYCYTCYVPINLLEGKIPQVKLPLKIDIIKHKQEIDGKSTSGHAAILAPQDVSVYTYPDIPDYENEEAILIFPSRSSISVSQLLNTGSYQEIKNIENPPDLSLPEGHSPCTLKKILRNRNDVLTGNANDTTANKKQSVPVSKAIFIDSTWNQSKGIYKDEKLNKIPCVVIENRISQFWRHQRGSPRWYLATIEAIHQFLVEYHVHLWGFNPHYKGIHNCFNEDTFVNFDSLYSNSIDSYNGQYDNLLYFFRHMYNLIHAYYDHDNLHAYKRRLQ